MKKLVPNNRRKCEVLLVHPPWFRLQNSSLVPYPVGPGHVAGVLEDAGIDTLIWNGDFDPDAALSVGGTNILKTDEMTRAYDQYLARLNDMNNPIWAEAMEIIELTSPKVIGFSAYSASFKSAANIATLVRQNYPHIPLVLGGIHATVEPEKSLHACQAFDVVVYGEAERTAPPLFTALLEGRNGIEDLGRLQGLVYRRKGKFVRTEPAELIYDLDALPRPARHLLIDLDRMPPHAFQMIYGFRGCPFRCIFCASYKVFGRHARMRSARSVADEIERVHKTYGTRYFYICDDIFNFKRQRAMEFCSIMQEKRLPVYYSVQARGEMLDMELLKAMKETGCQHVAIGVEVGDEEIRRLIKKGNTIEDMRKAAKMIRGAGLRMVGFFMFGFPWETKEQMLKTVALMEELNPCIAYPYIVTPTPGTELMDIAQNMGIFGGHMDYASFHHESPKMGVSVKIPENERTKLVDSILDRFTLHNKSSMRLDLLRRPRFYWAAASDAGITSSLSSMAKYLIKLLPWSGPKESDMHEIRGRVALVTGASAGIGYHTALQLAREGANVAIMARRRERLEECIAAARQENPQVSIVAHVGDVTSLEDVSKVVADVVDEFGSIDILVNNAGLGFRGSVVGSEMSDIRKIFEVNFFGMLNCIRETVPLMLKRNGGHIVNVSSFLGEKPLPGSAPYSAAKAAVTNLSECLSFELQGLPVSVTTFCPGMVQTEFYDKALYSDLPRWENLEGGDSPEVVAKAIVASIQSNKKRIVFGRKAKFLLFLNRFSRFLADKAVSVIKSDEIKAVQQKKSDWIKGRVSENQNRRK